tara:strand:+ start:863 stop:1054 length:192 start_codon:yes stop_codon:yes gene_type:complete
MPQYIFDLLMVTLERYEQHQKQGKQITMYEQGRVDLAKEILELNLRNNNCELTHKYKRIEGAK